MRGLVVVLALLGSACAGARPPGPVTLTILGTNDVHGRLTSVASYSGYVANARRAREKDGGAVLVVDAGDAFQGTLESNLDEGASLIAAYNALGVDAMAIGNHEFDFGPAGPVATPRGPGDDPRGALKARAKEARFPLLAANLSEGGRDLAWDNVPPSVIVERAGVKIGLVGVTTEDTAKVTIRANFEGMETRALPESIKAAAARLRAGGASVVIVLAHAGGDCEELTNPRDLSSCDPDEEIFRAARKLEGAVDLIVAGHTHAGVAHVVSGIPIIESAANGAYFGRVDLVVGGGRVASAKVYPPERICGTRDAKPCAEAAYEGAPVVPIAAVKAAVDGALAKAQQHREKRIPVEIAEAFARERDRESALGNLLSDLVRAAYPGSDVALMNGGGIRAPLPKGPLTYGALYETFPFDNRPARVKMTGGQLARVLERNLGSDKGLLSVAGVRVSARCGAATTELLVTRSDGAAIAADERLVVITSDFVATGGDGLLTGIVDPAAIEILEDGPNLRDAIADQLTRAGGTLHPADPHLFSPTQPRWTYPGTRPVQCERAATSMEP